MNAPNTARVIVGIDGSEQALAAVRAAAAEAHHRHEPLHIVHAFIWPSLHINVGPVADDLPRTGLRHYAEDLLEEAVAEAGKVAPRVPVTTALIEGGATPVLLEESHRAGLLVLGDRGMGGISSAIIGSVAVHAAAHARCPVLVIRGAEPAAGPIVVGVDGSEAAEHAVGFAFEECAHRGAELVAVLTWVDSTPVGARERYAPGYLAASIEQAARRTLSESLAGWREWYPDVVVRPELVHGHPRGALIEYSKTAQLVVLGSRGRDAFQGLLLGSVSQTLLHHAACPVAVVPPTSSPHRPGEQTSSPGRRWRTSASSSAARSTP
jgi:nucleotide-binding universal stress UspA family protein